jgi:hypothetical protein
MGAGGCRARVRGVGDFKQRAIRRFVTSESSSSSAVFRASVSGTKAPHVCFIGLRYNIRLNGHLIDFPFGKAICGLS